MTDQELCDLRNALETADAAFAERGRLRTLRDQLDLYLDDSKARAGQKATTFAITLRTDSMLKGPGLELSGIKFEELQAIHRLFVDRHVEAMRACDALVSPLHKP